MRGRVGARVGVAGLVVAALLAACIRPADKTAPVVVGAGSSPEQELLGALAVEALNEAGLEVQLRTGLGDTRGLRRAALSGDIDLYWDYTGAAWALGMGQQAPPANPAESFARVQRADAERGLTWLAPSGANATLALFVRRSDLPSGQGRRGLSWLAGVLSAGDRSLCADSDFLERSGGLEALAGPYQLDVRRVLEAAVPARERYALTYVSNGRCFAGLGTATSGRARRLGLVPMADNLGVFPAFVAAPVVRTSRLEQVPRIAPALASVASALDTETLAGLNAGMEAGDRAERLAADFLAAQ